MDIDWKFNEIVDKEYMNKKIDDNNIDVVIFLKLLLNFFEIIY